MGTDSAPIPQDELPDGNSETALQGRLERENQEFVEKYGPEFNGVWFVSDRVFDEGHQLASHMGGVRRIILGMNDVDPASFARQGFPRSEADLVLAMGTNGEGEIHFLKVIGSLSKITNLNRSTLVGSGTDRVTQIPEQQITNYPPLYLDNRSTPNLGQHLQEELTVLNTLISNRSIQEGYKKGYIPKTQSIPNLCQLCTSSLYNKEFSPQKEPFKITILGRPRIGKSSVWKIISTAMLENRGLPSSPYLSGRVTDLFASSAPQDLMGLSKGFTDQDVLTLRGNRARYNRTGYPHLSPAYVANKIAGIYGIPNPTNPAPPRETQSPALWLIDTGGLPTFKLSPEELDRLAHDDDYFQDNLHLLYDLPSLIAMNSSDLILYLESDDPDLDARLLAIADTFCPGKIAMLKNPFLRNPNLLKPSVIRDLRNQHGLMQDPVINDMIAQFLEETMQGIEQKYSPDGNLMRTIQQLVCHIRDYHFRQGDLTTLRSLGLSDNQIIEMCQIQPPTITSDWSLTDDLVRFAEVAF